jgi:membrane protein
MHMRKNTGGLFNILKAAFKDFGEDEAAVRAAALAYYTIFALPPLLILLITIAGVVWDPADVQRAMESQFAGMMGQEGARQIHTMIAQADRPGSGGLFATLASVAGLLFGATGALVQLQGALNRAWEVKPDPEEGGVIRFLLKRILSLGMLLGIGFLLAVSLALTSLVSTIGRAIGGGAAEPVLYVVDLVLSLAVLSLLFGATFRMLPDARVAWRDVWVGGLVTALLFVGGKFAIGLYLARSSPGDAFGAAGALAVVLVWTYYSGMILLFGAEFTQQWARQRGSGIEPKDGAVRVVETEQHVKAGEPGSRIGGKGAPPEPPRGDVAAQQRPEKVGLGQALLGIPVFLFLARRGRGRGKES